MVVLDGGRATSETTPADSVGKSLSSLLLSRLPGPVVRISWPALARACHGISRAATTNLPSSTAGVFGGLEVELVERYVLRNSATVVAALDQLWYAALSTRAAEGGSSSESGVLLREEFTHFHELLARALLSKTDEHARTVIADCEWALSGGSPRGLDRTAFSEWLFDVLEGWCSELSVDGLENLAKELCEAVRARAAPCQQYVYLCARCGTERAHAFRARTRLLHLHHSEQPTKRSHFALTARNVVTRR